MIVLNLKAKVCMSHLLLKPTFDTFSLIEGEVTTFNRFQVDGRIHKDFFDEAFEKEYSTWGEVRDFFFQITVERNSVKFQIHIISSKRSV